MRKIALLSIITLGFLASCTKDFLNTDPKGLVLETNYYRTRDEVLSGLYAVYNRLSVEAGGGDLAAIEPLVAGFAVQVAGGGQGRPAHHPAAADEDG